MISGRVLVTGGSGSLGTAILRRAEQERWDARLVVFSRDEAKQAAVTERYPGTRCILGDVRDLDSLEAAMRGADVVIHAAAYKRVPEAEAQPLACVEANVAGSANVVAVAHRLGIPKLVGISTDKACHPINVYGATKLLMERLFTSLGYTVTRYGNVLASTGSVVPALRAQMAVGSVRLTDPTATRFWLTLDDAVDLVIEALDIPSGHVLIPRARASTMATLVGAVAPGVAIVPIPNRGGEKPHETLLNAHEAPYATTVETGWLLGPMVGDTHGRLPPGMSYTSDHAPQFGVAELADLIARMDAGETVRTIA